MLPAKIINKHDTVYAGENNNQGAWLSLPAYFTLRLAKYPLFLISAGYIAETACDGVEAISMFTEFTYDLILPDIMLPKMNGYNVCELIRKQSQIPMLMLTALGSEEEQLSFFAVQKQMMMIHILFVIRICL